MNVVKVWPVVTKKRAALPQGLDMREGVVRGEGLVLLFELVLAGIR